MDEKNEKFLHQVRKKFPEFVEATDGLCLADLNKKLLTYAKHREETELAKKHDQELQGAKEQVSELNGPYQDALNALKMKTAYINLLIRGDDKQAMERNKFDDQEKD